MNIPLIVFSVCVLAVDGALLYVIDLILRNRFL
jgi:hypothetical protein